VELSLAEARVESCRRKIEAEMRMQSEQQVTGISVELAHYHIPVGHCSVGPKGLGLAGTSRVGV